MPRSLRRATAAALTAILAAGGIGLGAAAANADSTQTFSGVLETGDPTWQRPNGCDSPSTSRAAQYYDTQSFTVPETGGYRIEMTSHALDVPVPEHSTDGYFYLYEGAFDPATPADCIAYDDDGTGTFRPRIDAALTAGATYTLVTTQFSNPANESRYSYAFEVEGVYPSVVIAPAAGQARAFTSGPARFAATFSEPVVGFDAEDVQLYGAGPTSVSVTGSGATYEIIVDGFDQYGGYVVGIGEGAATSIASERASVGSESLAFSYVESLPTATIAPIGETTITTEPATFAVTFSEPVEGFGADGVVLGGTAGASTVTVTGEGPDYVVTVGGFAGAGAVEASIRAEAAYVVVPGGEVGPEQRIGNAASDVASVTFAPLVVDPTPTATAPAPTTSAPVAPAPTSAAPALSPSRGELPRTGGSPLWIALLLAGALVAAGVGVRRVARTR